jgi:hypothetical protein
LVLTCSVAIPAIDGPTGAPQKAFPRLLGVRKLSSGRSGRGPAGGKTAARPFVRPSRAPAEPGANVRSADLGGRTRGPVIEPGREGTLREHALTLGPMS